MMCQRNIYGVWMYDLIILNIKLKLFVILPFHFRHEPNTSLK